MENISKEEAARRVNLAATIYIILTILALPIGYTVSYWCQPGLFRQKCSLGAYFTHIGDVLRNDDLGFTAFLVTVLVASAIIIFGAWFLHRTKIAAAAVISTEEIKLNGLKSDAAKTLLAHGKQAINAAEKFIVDKMPWENISGLDTMTEAQRWRVARWILIAIGIILLLLILM